MASNLVLILGGVASGKSIYAEGLTERYGKNLTYLATATADDEEMAQKIKHHQERRKDNWITVEEPLAIHKVFDKTDSNAVLIECLTMWLLNLMNANVCLVEAYDNLMEAVNSYSGAVVMVSGETGMGIIPNNKFSREYCSNLGILNQRIGGYSTLLMMIVAGQPLVIRRR